MSNITAITEHDYELFRCKAITKKGSRCKRLRCIGDKDFCRQHNTLGKKTPQFECPICYEKVYITEGISLDLSCGHKFCADCISKWTIKKSTCPLCRGDVLVGDFRKCLQHSVTTKILILINFRNISIVNVYFDYLGLMKRHNLCSEEHDRRCGMFNYLEQHFNNRIITKSLWKGTVLPVFDKIFYGFDDYEFESTFIRTNNNFSSFYLTNNPEITLDTTYIYNRLLFNR